MAYLFLVLGRGYLVLVLAASMIAGSTQSRALSALTVPAAALPGGCALRPVPAQSPAPVARDGVTVILGTAWSRLPTNPWTGTDRETVAAVHKAIDATPGRPLPDLPPEAWRGAAFERKWADNILEAYHAAYVSAGGRQVEVFAVTFNDVKLTPAPESVSAMLNPPRGITTRVVRGATVVRVSAPSSTECFEAVRAYIESLK